MRLLLIQRQSSVTLARHYVTVKVEHKCFISVQKSALIRNHIIKSFFNLIEHLQLQRLTEY